MKDVIRLFGVLILGLIVAIFCYPFLHETGHAIAIILSGAELYEFRVLPIPYISCNVYSIGNVQQCLIGIAGMIFPFLISFFIGRNNFWMWLVSLLIKGISALAFAISYLAVLCYETDILWVNEDIVKVVQISEIKSSFWLLFSLVMFCFAVIVLYYEKPIERFKNYFEI